MTNDLQGLIKNLDTAGAMGYWLREFYKEGTWTPIFTGTTGAGSVTFSRQNARYIRMGALVIAWCNQLLVNVVSSSPTGNLVVDGLPFAARNQTNYTQGGFIHQWNSLNLTAGCIDLTLRIAEGNDYVELVENFDNTAAVALAGSALANGSFLSFTAIYETE